MALPASYVSEIRLISNKKLLMRKLRNTENLKNYIKAGPFPLLHPVWLLTSLKKIHVVKKEKDDKPTDEAPERI